MRVKNKNGTYMAIPEREVMGCLPKWEELAWKGKALSLDGMK